MIIKNNFYKKQEDYLKKEKEGLEIAIKNFDKRFRKKEVERDNFLKQNMEFAKKSKKIKKKQEKLNKK